MNPTHKNLIDYFESLNANLVDFGDNSFFRMDLHEIQGAFKTDATFPCMTVESPEGDSADSNEISSQIGRTWAFTVYKNPEDKNYAEQNQFLDDCEVIGLKILKRMKRDSLTPGHLLHDKFDIRSCSWIKVGPIFTNKLYGYRFMGVLKGHEDMQVDHNDWNDLDSNC